MGNFQSWQRRLEYSKMLTFKRILSTSLFNQVCASLALTHGQPYTCVSVQERLDFRDWNRWEDSARSATGFVARKKKKGGKKRREGHSPLSRRCPRGPHRQHLPRYRASVNAIREMKFHFPRLLPNSPAIRSLRFPTSCRGRGSVRLRCVALWASTINLGKMRAESARSCGRALTRSAVRRRGLQRAIVAQVCV